jgi:Na+-driven multidrug efflux pump
MGARGAGIATSISNFTLMIGLHYYTERYFDKEIKELAWFYPFDFNHKSDCFDRKGLKDYFLAGIPSTGMLCMESWAFHFMTLFSALISVKATAVQVISLNIGALFYMPTLGLQ